MVENRQRNTGENSSLPMRQRIENDEIELLRLKMGHMQEKLSVTDYISRQVRNLERNVDDLYELGSTAHYNSSAIKAHSRLGPPPVSGATFHQSILDRE